MKQSPLKRYTPLRAKKPIRRASEKGLKELARHTKLKKELIEEFGEICMTCGIFDRAITLSHIIAKGKGGKTDRENCILECLDCHTKYEKHPERRPQRQKDKYSIG